MNEVLEEEHVKWAVHGSYSGFHVYTNPDNADITPSTFDAVAFIQTMIDDKRGARVSPALRMGMLVNGVDMNSGPSGTISATHGDDEMNVTVDAFRSSDPLAAARGGIGLRWAREHGNERRSGGDPQHQPLSGARRPPVHQLRQRAHAAQRQPDAAGGARGDRRRRRASSSTSTS